MNGGGGVWQRLLAFFRWLRLAPASEADFAGEQTLTGEELRRRLIALFRGLRAKGFNLGVAELLDALELLDGGWSGDSPAGWQADLRLLCCRNRTEAAVFDEIWAAVWQSAPRLEKPKDLRDKPRQDSGNTEAGASPKAETEVRETSAVEVEPEILPVQPFAPAMEENRDEMTLRFPLTRRVMAYGWRHLRLPQPDGPADWLDLTATIEQTARQGFYLSPVFRRRERDHAHLVLLVDQGGSMTPFHRFTRDLIETALEQIKPSAPEDDAQSPPRVEVYYFHNQMADNLHRDPRLTDPVSANDALTRSDNESCILVVSDAGAARVYRRRERIRAAGAMVASLRQRTHLLAWLNPMPESRWRGASAEVIAELTPMFQMTPDGFGNAIDALRGLS